MKEVNYEACSRIVKLFHPASIKERVEAAVSECVEVYTESPSSFFDRMMLVESTLRKHVEHFQLLIDTNAADLVQKHLVTEILIQLPKISARLEELIVAELDNALPGRLSAFRELTRRDIFSAIDDFVRKSPEVAPEVEKAQEPVVPEQGPPVIKTERASDGTNRGKVTIWLGTKNEASVHISDLATIEGVSFNSPYKLPTKL